MSTQKNVFQRSLESSVWQGIGVLVAFLSLVITIISFLLNLLMEYGEIVNSLNKSGWDKEIIGIWQIVVLTFKDVYFLIGITTIILIFSSPLFAKVIRPQMKIKTLRMLQKWTLNFCLFCVALAAAFQRTAAVLVLSLALIKILDIVQENYQCKNDDEGTVIFQSNLGSSHSHYSTYPKADRIDDNYVLVSEEKSQSISPQALRPERTQPIPRPVERQVQLVNPQRV